MTNNREKAKVLLSVGAATGLLVPIATNFSRTGYRRYFIELQETYALALEDYNMGRITEAELEEVSNMVLAEIEKFYDKLPENQGVVLDFLGYEGTGDIIHDVSRYHNNGVFGAGAAAPTWVQLPSGLWVLDFDGTDDYITLPDDLLSGLDNLTVGFWTKIDAIDDWDTFFGADWVAPHPLMININPDRGITIDQSISHPTTETGFISAGAWMCLFFVKSGTTWSIYKDGVFVDSITSVDYPAIDVTTGHRYTFFCIFYISVLTRFIDGLGGKLRVYNRALSPLEIHNRFNQEKHLFGF